LDAGRQMAEEEENSLALGGGRFHEGQFVKILSKSPLRPLDDPHAAPLDLDGHIGRTMGEVSGRWTIETFSGAWVEVPASQLTTYLPPPGDEGGFDAAWPSHEDLSEGFCMDIAEKLSQRGFCVVQCFMSPEAQSSAHEAADSLETWLRFPLQIESGYLGRDAGGKVAWLEADQPENPITNSLEMGDRMLTELSQMMAPMTQSVFGFDAVGRTDGLVRRPFTNSADEDTVMKAREVLSDTDIQVKGRIEQHLKWLQSRKVCMLYCVGGGDSSLTLHTSGGANIKVSCDGGKLVIFRNDTMTYTFKPGSGALALQAWILAPGPNATIQEYEGPAQFLDVAMGLELGPMAPQYGNTGKSVSLMTMDCILAANGIGSDFYWNFLVSGTDGCRHLSIQRWDPTWYYEPNKDFALGKYYSNHGGFVLEEALMGFDNQFFEITDYVAANMDPLQRNTLEVGYNVLFKAGFNRQNLKGNFIGFFIGNCGTDWTSTKLHPGIVPVDTEYIHYVCNHPTNARLSYIFGMRGPMSTADTACSSSLVATGVSHNAMRRVEPDQARINNGDQDMKWSVAMGTNALLGPFSWIGLCGPHMLSPTGRCFTFDHSADGFGRGEGTSGLTMHVTDSEPSGRLAMFCGTCINQDGRSASMTAPHGPSQQECIWASLREANVVPADVRIAELHGTGTALGDPIEVGALRGVMKARDGPIMKTSAKSNIAHGEANAGMAGLIKCFMMLMHGTTPPNVHLCALNPHIDAHAYPVFFCDEMCDLGTNSGYAGVCSFGFGGTNARADLWARCSIGPRSANTMNWEKLDFVMVRCPRCMGWMDYVGCNMIPSNPPKAPPEIGRFKASSVREECDPYEVCSLCYKGSYQVGGAVSESPVPGGRLFITGTWDHWISKHEVVGPDGSGVYHYVFLMGETRIEQFRLMMEENIDFSFYPACKRAGMGIRIEGPKAYKEGHTWLVDGREEDWREGTLMHISFWADPADGSRHVAWKAVDSDKNPELAGLLGGRAPYRHRYFVIGSWNAYRMITMSPVRDQPGEYECTVKFGVSGQESFQFCRDADAEQLIYPADPNGGLDSPVRGPDHLGRSNMFSVIGAQGESASIRLSVRDGHITVSAIHSSISRLSRKWESVNGRDRKVFYVTDVRPDGVEYHRMEQDQSSPDMYKLQVSLIGGSMSREFQIVLDRDPNRAFYPELPGLASGSSFVFGPDSSGPTNNFRIEGMPGTTFEIILNLKEPDFRRIITWRPIIEAGMPMLPWTNAQYLP